ncbi:hypothetical protein BDU57DRAFT_542220 [Ampelomyces quisqualis]|uniref:DUF7730 domain-containing protein n=1 Tax=Ampelomyces quisqualis TaxID=50730 RepID=A0A6A5QAG7_AMPQU|nr:hypothetical protein BDU57DRAFT_542220 [Ampelomyces quisqualis]
MALQQRSVGLSQEEANVITMRNQCHSPLLRLPAELRNKIFGYALGGLSIKFTKGPHKPSDRRRYAYDPVWARLVAHNEASSKDNDVSIANLTGVLKTCRQIHTETSTLLLEINTLELLPTELNDFLNDLTNRQRDAISSFRITLLYPFDPVKNSFSAHFKRYYSRVKAVGFDVWSGYENLARMRGLKRVIIGKGCLNEIYPIPSFDSVVAQVKTYTGGRNLEVIFEDMTAPET